MSLASGQSSMSALRASAARPRPRRGPRPRRRSAWAGQERFNVAST
ncbi:hypothetical protein SO694_0000201 [Aureococcus anophagefferens]|uniref:Uncharacterized protein n=1 Tax=Aureococcus anophagefferens TaxID=44056 RepID=A0ABR1GCN7_AURAN